MKKPAPLSLKPDLDDAARRWDAFYHGEIIDRPLVWITAPKPGAAPHKPLNYRRRAMDDIDKVIDDVLSNCEGVYWGGESVPAFFPSIGTDEVAVFCGAELEWNDASGDTNWSQHYVTDWEKALPFRVHTDNPYYQRVLALVRRAAQRLDGKMLISGLDWHTNMDMLMSVRGSENLCMDLVDQPEMIDKAMVSARAVFRQVWDAVAKEAQMATRGYCHQIYSMEGAATLQCDFSCMISPDMFDRWVRPALEEEASIVNHVIYHWDGPGAQKHLDALAGTKGIHTFYYEPGDGHGGFRDYIDLFQRVQKAGRSVAVRGLADDVKFMHKHLKPEKTLYYSAADTPQEADALLEWFVKNT
jgi:hypothetical protein